MKVRHLLILLALVSIVPLVARATAYWAHFHAKTLPVLYDYDNDTVPELVLPGMIIDNYQALQSPYPRGAPVVADPLCRGKPYLVIIGNGKVYIYNGMTLVTALQAENETARVYWHGLLLNHTLYWCGHLYRVNVTGVPVDNAPIPLILYYDGWMRAEAVGKNATWSIYPGLRPLAAFIDYNGTILVASVNNDSKLVIVSWMPGAAPRLSAYDIKPLKVIGYNGTGFYVVAKKGLYHASLNQLLLISTWKVIGHDNRYIYLYRDGRVAVVSKATGRTVIVLPTPRKSAPIAACCYPFLTLLYRDGIYVKYTGPVPFIEIYGPTVLLAGEHATYKVKVTPPAREVILVDGAPAKSNNITFTTPGWHNITVVASRGPVTVTRTLMVYVYPRPLTIAIDVRKPPTPNGTMKLVVETFDEERRVEIPIVIRVGNVTVNATSWRLVDVPTPWSPRMGDWVYVTVSAADTLHRGRSRTFLLRWSPVPVKPVVSYLGGNTFQIDMASPSGGVVHGMITVMLAGRILYSGPSPARIKLNDTGVYHLTVKFTPYTPAFRGGVYTVNINFTETSKPVPRTANITVVEVVKTVTKTVTVAGGAANTTTPQAPRPATLPAPPRPTPAPRPGTAVRHHYSTGGGGSVTLVVLAIAGVVGYLLLSSRRRRVSESGGGGEDVGFE